MTPRACVGTVLVLIALAAPAAALEFRSGRRVEVAAGETVVGDLYATGETVTILGTVTGDLVAAGREIRVTGRVEGDLIAAGQAVVVEGGVGDDVRMAGMVLLLADGGVVADHVVSAGFALEAAPGSTVEGSLLFSGYQALLDGRIQGGLTGSAHAMELDGEIGGDVDLRIGGGPGGASVSIRLLPAPVPIPEVIPGLSVGESARIGGTLSYRASHEGVIAPAAVIDGGAQWRQIPVREPAAAEPEQIVDEAPTLRQRAARTLRRAGSLLVIGLLLIGLAPRWLEARVDFLGRRLLAALGGGVLTYLAGPLAALVLLVATVLVAVLLGVAGLGGLAVTAVALGLVSLALLMVSYLAAILWIAPALVGLAAGRWLLARAGVRAAAGRIAPLLLGVALYVLLRAVPLLGAAIGVLVMLFGMGALGNWLVTARRG